MNIRFLGSKQINQKSQGPLGRPSSVDRRPWTIFRCSNVYVSTIGKVAENQIYLLILCFLTLPFAQSFGQEKVYYNQTEFGVLYGNSVDNWSGENRNRIDLSVITFHGAKISDHHVVGLSVGFDQYESLTVIPFAIGWRGLWGKENKPQLIGGFDFGGGSPLFEDKEKTEWYESWYKSGVMMSPSIGVKFPAKKGRTALTMTLAYKRQELGYFMGYFERGDNPRPITHSQLPPGYSSITETSYLFHSLVARIGLMF